MTNVNAAKDFILNNILNNSGFNIKDQKNIWALAGEFEVLFEEMQDGQYGDTIQFEGYESKTFDEFLEEFGPEIFEDLSQNNIWLNFSLFSNKGAKNFPNSVETLTALWNNNNNGRTTARRDAAGSTAASRTRTNNNNNNTNTKTVINNEGLEKIRNLKNNTAVQADTIAVQDEISQPVIEKPAIDLLEGKTPEEKKTILEQTIQSQRDNISSIQNGSNETVQRAEQRLQNAENAMNQAIDRDNNINNEVKAQVKESESAITAKSGEVSAKQAEIAQTDASITQTQSTISNLQSALSSLPSPSGKEEDKEKDAKLAARKAELQSQIAAKQAELAQLQAQKQQQEAEKAQLEGEKSQLETQKEQIVAEELKDASPATKAAIQAYENSRTTVENTKTNELQKAQTQLNSTMEKLSEVEAEIEQQKNNKANTNFDINGIIDAFAQGQTGDCWLLSSLESLSNSEEGRKLLQNAIQINDDGTYTVKFDGADWAINITDTDLRAARNSGQYSNGDDDVLLMEVAMQNYLTQVRDGQVQINSADINATAAEGGINPLNSGRSTNLTELLTGKTNWSIGTGSNIDELFNQIQNNRENTFATLSFKAGGNGALNTLNAGTVVTGASADSGHLWSIKSVSGNNITLVNPWDSEQEIVTTKDELAKSDIQFTYQELAA